MEIGPWLRFVLAALATWRVTHLVVYEDGPWDLIVKIRRRAGNGFWGRLMDCFYCASMWVAAAVAFAVRPSPGDWVLVWLALSGAACLLDRAAREPVAIQPLAKYEEEGEAGNVMLRSESREGPDGDAGPGAGTHAG
jgi:hypothetical protein